MLTVLLIIFWLAFIVAAVNVSKERRERARSEAAEIARQKALRERLDADLEQSERNAEERIARIMQNEE